jgi:hypothetical protein
MNADKHKNLLYFKEPFLKNFLVSLSLIFVLFSVLPLTGHAAELAVNSKNQEIKIDEQFEVSIFLDTEDENINALEGKIMFPADLLELKEIRDGNSIINFWIERPEVKSDNKKIIFSGITPGGYADDQGLIFSMIFQSKKEGNGFIEIRNAKTLLNDGKGTEAKLRISNFQFLISKEAPAKAPIPEIKDTDPPELFTPEIARDSNIFNGKWFLVFATQDKGSGIDYYEVREGKKNFIIAESPYLLENQNLDKEITVKAIDKAGNKRIVTLPPQNPPAWYEKYLAFIIIIGVIFIYAFWQILRKFFKPQDKLGAGQETNGEK